MRVAADEAGRLGVLAGKVELTARKSGRIVEVSTGQRVSFEPGRSIGKTRPVELPGLERWWEIASTRP